MQRTVILNINDVKEVIDNIKSELLLRSFHSDYIDTELNILNDMLSYKHKMNISLTKKLRADAPQLINHISPIEVYRDAIFEAWGVDIHCLYIKSRERIYLHYRQCFHYLLRLAMGNLLSLKDIGEYTKQHHSTAIHSVKTIQDLIDTNDKETIHLITKALKALEQKELCYIGIDEKTKLNIIEYAN